MTTKKIVQPAMDIIEAYLHMPIGKYTVACPYMNNKKTKVRAGLRVHLGKGSVEDIVQEIAIIARKKHVDLVSLSQEEVKKFLVDNAIGIDCSGLAYYILNAQMIAQTTKPLYSLLSFPKTNNLFRRLVRKFRTIENTNVRVLADNKNSQKISLNTIEPGDCIIMLDTGKRHDLDHMLIVHQVDYEDGAPKIIHYTHSLAWLADGKYNHGVRQGNITVTDTKKDMSQQTWQECEKIGEENETFGRAKSAKILEIRRLIT